MLFLEFTECKLFRVADYETAATIIRSDITKNLNKRLIGVPPFSAIQAVPQLTPIEKKLLTGKASSVLNK